MGVYFSALRQAGYRFAVPHWRVLKSSWNSPWLYSATFYRTKQNKVAVGITVPISRLLIPNPWELERGSARLLIMPRHVALNIGTMRNLDSILEYARTIGAIRWPHDSRYIMNSSIPIRSRARLCRFSVQCRGQPRHLYATAAAKRPEIFDVVCVGGGPAGLSLLAALREAYGTTIA